MSSASYALLITGVFLNAAAQLMLKAGTNAVGHIEYSMAGVIASAPKIATQLPIVGGLACYVLSVVVWILGLSRVDVSVAYPLLSLGYVINAVAAWMLFGEAFSLQKVLGIGVIILGVVLVTRS